MRATTRCSSSSSSSKPSGKENKKVLALKVGQVVAIQRSASLKRKPELAIITGASSSGDTVDVEPLEQFVNELYIKSKKVTSSFEQSSDIYPVQFEFAPTQDGWIILDADLLPAITHFESRSRSPSLNPPSLNAQVEKREFSESDLKRQAFMPTKGQAFAAAALSLPLAASFYAAFVTVRDVYEKQSAASGDVSPLTNSAFFKSLILFTTQSASVLSIVVGCSLFLFAISKKEDEQ